MLIIKLKLIGAALLLFIFYLALGGLLQLIANIVRRKRNVK